MRAARASVCTAPIAWPRVEGERDGDEPRGQRRERGARRGGGGGGEGGEEQAQTPRAAGWAARRGAAERRSRRARRPPAATAAMRATRARVGMRQGRSVEGACKKEGISHLYPRPPPPIRARYSWSIIALSQIRYSARYVHNTIPTAEQADQVCDTRENIFMSRGHGPSLAITPRFHTPGIHPGSRTYLGGVLQELVNVRRDERGAAAVDRRREASRARSTPSTSTAPPASGPRCRYELPSTSRASAQSPRKRRPPASSSASAAGGTRRRRSSSGARTTTRGRRARNCARSTTPAFILLLK